MWVKLSVNTDHYLSDFFWIRYVLFWLKKQVMQYTESQSSYELLIIDSYVTADNIFSDL